MEDLSDPTNPTAQINVNSDGSATYYPSQEDYGNGQVTITLVGYPLNPCSDQVQDSLTITFAEPPTIDAGPDQTLCEDTTSVDLNGIASFNNSLLWVSSGNGTFNDNTNPITQYIPSQQDIDAGSVTLTANVEGDVN